jgi:small-conductance mechanosensitive channel
VSEFIDYIAGLWASLLTRDVLTELAAVGLCLLIGWGAGAIARSWQARQPVTAKPLGIDWHGIIVQGGVLVSPFVVALLLVLFVRGVLHAIGFDTSLLDLAVRLIGFYILVRSCVYLFTSSLNPTSWMRAWEKRAAIAIWFAIAAEIFGWLNAIINTLDGIGVAAGRGRISLWSVLKLLFTVTLFVLAAAWVSRWLERRLMKLDTLAVSTRLGIAKFISVFLFSLSFLLGLNAAGIDLTALTVLTGAIGVGLGFGLQPIAANFVSGFVLLMDRSIKPGDVISFSGQPGTSTEGFGWVQELRGRYVVVRDRDGVETLVPNQHFIVNTIINWSYTDPRVRLKLPVRISYKDDPELALNILLRACDEQKRVLRDPGPVSRLMQFSDHGIDLELRFWISDPQAGVNNVRSDVNRAIWRLFKQQGITIPTAQREVFLHNLPPSTQ